jgi:hypothetical protein
MGPCFRRDDVEKFSNSKQLQKGVRPRSAKRPRFYPKIPPSPNRGRRECRAPDAPAAACVVVVSTRVSHHGHTGSTRHSPRNGFNGFLRALPGDRACLPPSLADCSANLTPASGCQDHTTSPSALASPVKRASASIASRAASVTSRAAPLKWDRTAGDIGLSRVGRQEEYFLRKGFTDFWGDLPVG